MRKGQLRSPVEDESENLLVDRICDTILVNPGTTINELKENIAGCMACIEEDYNTYVHKIRTQ